MSIIHSQQEENQSALWRIVPGVLSRISSQWTNEGSEWEGARQFPKKRLSVSVTLLRLSTFNLSLVDDCIVHSFWSGSSREDDFSLFFESPGCSITPRFGMIQKFTNDHCLVASIFFSSHNLWMYASSMHKIISWSGIFSLFYLSLLYFGRQRTRRPFLIRWTVQKIQRHCAAQDISFRFSRHKDCDVSERNKSGKKKDRHTWVTFQELANLRGGPIYAWLVWVYECTYYCKIRN